MSNNLLTKLGEKIQNAVETIELLKLEINELREENRRLRAEKEEWDENLVALIDQFESLEDEISETAQDEAEEEIDEDEDEYISDEYEEEDEDDDELVETSELDEDEDDEDEYPEALSA